MHENTNGSMGGNSVGGSGGYVGYGGVGVEDNEAALLREIEELDKQLDVIRSPDRKMEGLNDSDESEDGLENGLVNEKEAWEEYSDDEGYVYYYNSNTGESTWDEPVVHSPGKGISDAPKTKNEKNNKNNKHTTKKEKEEKESKESKEQPSELTERQQQLLMMTLNPRQQSLLQRTLHPELVNVADNDISTSATKEEKDEKKNQDEKKDDVAGEDDSALDMIENDVVPVDGTAVTEIDAETDAKVTEIDAKVGDAKDGDVDEVYVTGRSSSM